MKKKKQLKTIGREVSYLNLEMKQVIPNSSSEKSKSDKIIYLIFLILFSTSSIAVCDLASTDFSCTCSGGYPCSSPDCTPQCDGGICGAKDHYTFTGSCFAIGLTGYCEVDDCEECSYQCNDDTGCYGNCCGDSQCSADYDYCSGVDIYTRDYFCSSYYCSYDNNFKESCGFSGDYSLPYCSSSSVSTKVRDVGICDTFLGVPFCSTEDDYLNTNCAYGCAQGLSETEFEYKCSGTLKDYITRSRDVYGYCRIDNSAVFSDYGTGLYCPDNTWCSTDLDEIVKTYIYQLTLPCETFSPSITTNTGIYTALTNSSYAFKGVSSQTYTPDRTCFDSGNDGSIDSCYGTGYSGNWDDYYYVNTSYPGTKYIKIYQYNTVYNFSDSEVKQYRIVDSYTDAEISINYGLNLNYEGNISVEASFSSDSSITSGTFLAKCWNSVDSGMVCYGTVDNCNTYCPAHTRISDVIDSTYEVLSSSFKTQTVTLIAFSTIGYDTDSVSVCFNDYSSGLYCGSCFDNIINQDETSIDSGGLVCGTCFDNTYNPASGETYTDYGGKCGSCFDGVKQNFETEVDYGGVCGNCTGVKSNDYKYVIAREVDHEIPFDITYCLEKSDSIILSSFLLLIGLIGLSSFFLIIIAIFLLTPLISNIITIVFFVKNLISKLSKKRK